MTRYGFRFKVIINKLCRVLKFRTSLYEFMKMWTSWIKSGLQIYNKQGTASTFIETNQRWPILSLQLSLYVCDCYFNLSESVLPNQHHTQRCLWISSCQLYMQIKDRDKNTTISPAYESTQYNIRGQSYDSCGQLQYMSLYCGEMTTFR